jgi:glyoxylase-like metal-dependent hydrolase (beta-lactamase superfamily II)
MTEPKQAAAAAEEVVSGVWWWAVGDDRIGGFTSSAHAVRGESGFVLVDPLPLAQPLKPVEAIVLTSGSHERSSWRLRRETGVPVYAPAAVRLVEEEPDVRYSAGDTLPGALLAYEAPGPGTTQHALLRQKVLFTADLFVHPPGSQLGFIPDQFLHDPEETRRTAHNLLRLDFDVLCTGHGRPLVDDPKAAIRALLDHE